MPGNPRKPCLMPPVVQQSTGQAGPEVNRDLEVLFEAVNQLARCTRKVSEYLDGGSSGGGFGGGGGSTSPPNPPSPPTPHPPETPDFLIINADASFTLPEEVSGDVFINPSTDVTVTLGTPMYGSRLRLFHIGTANTIAVETPASTLIDDLQPGQMMEPAVFPSDTNEPEWVTGVIVLGKTGTVYTSHSIVMRDPDAGFVQKDQTDGEFYRLELNSGSGTYDSEGATEPDI